MRSRIVQLGALLALLGAGIAAPPAAASGPVSLGTYVVCGYDNTGPAVENCGSLQDAIDAAGGTDGTVTIEMMPGKYCPPVFPALNNIRWQEMDFVGIGLGAFGSAGTTLTGPEAELTEFTWNATCGTSAPTAMIDVANSGASTGAVSLRNLAVAGQPAAGPTTGIHVSAASVGLRDVIVEGFSTGIDASNNSSSFHVNVSSSAVVDNSTLGVSFAGTSGGDSIDRSTVANNGIGVQESGTRTVNLGNDTIAHNSTGWSGASTGFQVVNTINAANTGVDCAGTGWESGGGSSNNLVGSSCTHAAPGDIVATDSIGAFADNGGPTWSILPPAQAASAGVTACNWTSTSGALDQREYLQTNPGSPCDIGSVENSHSSSTGAVEAAPLAGSTIDMGIVQPGQQGGQLIDADPSDGGVVYGYDVTVSGTGFELSLDTCSRAVLTLNEICYVGVTGTPTAKHPTITGKLKITLSTATLTYQLTAESPDVTKLAAAETATIDYGGSRTLKTTLTDTTTHQPVAGAQLTLQGKAAGASSFAKVASAVTSAHGSASIKVRPHVNTVYRWRYLGSDTQAASVSAEATVHVAQGVTAKLADRSVAKGKTVKVTGTVSPTAIGHAVQLQERRHGHWINKATTKVHGHTFAIHTSYTERGKHTLRVKSPATASNGAGVSPTLTLHTT